MHLAWLGFPTLGQLIDYLKGLQYTEDHEEPGRFVMRHPDPGEDSLFIFRDRDRNAPAREGEMMLVGKQLTIRGIVSEHDFAFFWANTVLRNMQAAT